MRDRQVEDADADVRAALLAHDPAHQNPLRVDTHDAVQGEGIDVPRDLLGDDHIRSAVVLRDSPGTVRDVDAVRAIETRTD